jgi:hypothetical protein
MDELREKLLKRCEEYTPLILNLQAKVLEMVKELEFERRQSSQMKEQLNFLTSGNISSL